VARRSSTTDDAIYFEAPAAFRAWLEEHHATAAELLVGFHKKHTGRPTLTWPESVDEALCYGWIDGIRRSVDAERYTIRFTPRRPQSIWSRVNVERVSLLTREGRMRPAGRRAFEAMRPNRSGTYSFERPHASLAPKEIAAFKRNRAAWRFWDEQPPGYRKTATHWVVSAVKSETRAKRLATLIADSAAGLRIARLRPTPKRPA
jgi:uncharacterized protein YdeI (YjbR/CyaY-like superfamily)